MGPSHGVKFFKNCYITGPLHSVQCFRNGRSNEGPPRATGPARKLAPAGAVQGLQLPSVLIDLPHRRQGDNVGKKLCSGTWSTSSLSSFSGLGASGLFLFHFSHSSPTAAPQGFLAFLQSVLPEGPLVLLMGSALPAAGPSEGWQGSALPNTGTAPVSSYRSQPCSHPTTKTLSHNPNTVKQMTKEVRGYGRNRVDKIVSIWLVYSRKIRANRLVLFFKHGRADGNQSGEAKEEGVFAKANTRVSPQRHQKFIPTDRAKGRNVFIGLEVGWRFYTAETATGENRISTAVGHCKRNAPSSGWNCCLGKPLGKLLVAWEMPR